MNQPKPNPEAEKAQMESQSKQAEMQQAGQLEGMKLQAAQQSEQMRLQADAEKFQLQQQSDAQKTQFSMQLESMKQETLKQIEAQRLEFEMWKVKLQEATKLRIAGLKNKETVEGAEIELEAGEIEETGALDKILQAQEMSSMQLNQGLNTLIDLMQRPRQRQLIRDANGTPVSAIETLQ